MSEEGVRVMGLGVGLFLLILLWTITLLTILIFTRFSSATGIFITSLSVIITAILIAIPRNNPNVEDPATDDLIGTFKVFDKQIIWKISLVLFLSFFSLIGCVSFIKTHCYYHIYPQNLRNKVK